MEFGVFAQLFVPKFERAVDPQAEHKRIMRNVEVAKAADRTASSTCGARSTTSSTSTRHMPGPEAFLSFCAAQTERVHLGSAIFNITPPVNKPARVAENVALLDHLTEQPLRVRHRPGLVDHRGVRLRHRRHQRDQGDVARDDREIPKMWKDGQYSYEGTYFRMPEREVFPKPHGPLAPAPCGWRPAAPDVHRGRRARPRRVLLHQRRRRADRAARRQLQGRRSPTPRRSATTSTTTSWASPTCSAWRTGSKAFEVAVQHGHELLHEPRVPLARQHPEARRASRSGPTSSPSPRPSRSRRCRPSGFVVVGDPDDCAKAMQQWDDIGVDQLTFSPTTNTLPTEVVVAVDGAVRRARSSRSSTRTRCTPPPATASGGSRGRAPTTTRATSVG